ncbi:MAG: multicopper oxidase domain-containing protein [Bryobacteraceae bacterium]
MGFQNGHRIAQDNAPLPALLDPGQLTPFVDPLSIPPIAVANGRRPSPVKSEAHLPYYRIPIHEFMAKVHRDLPPTRFWGYGGSVPGPTIETRSGEGVLVEWPNELPLKHFLPIDHNLMGAETSKPAVRTVVHLHGAKAPPISDGYPENWYTPGKSAVYHYPNEQEPAQLWYHDHAMGINRLNIYAGMLGLFMIRDGTEDALDLPKGKYEIPLVFFDRFLTLEGQLYYPVSRRPHAPWVPEVFGNAMLINGTLLPYLDVEPRRYRFRILNGSNGRFCNLSFANGLIFSQIGSDGGLLGGPVSAKILSIAPGERYDVLVDFSAHSGDVFVLRNDVLDVMQIRVTRAPQTNAAPFPKTLRSVPKIDESSAVKTRLLTLDEVDDLLDEPVTHLLNATRWHEPITEKPIADTTEIWSLVNMTDDTHPIHLHLVRFQILDRRNFDQTEYRYRKNLRYTGPAMPPEPGETGWKDTVRAYPGMVTRIIIHFAGYTGRYVWHCHILEHEDNEMMRPYEVTAAT